MEIQSSIMFRWDPNSAQWMPVRQQGWLHRLADIFEEESHIKRGHMFSDITPDGHSRPRESQRFRKIHWIFLRANG